MKKLIFYVILFGLVVVACQSNAEEVTPAQESISVDMSDFYVFTNDDEFSAKSNGKTVLDRCHSMQVLNRQLNENPGLYQKMYDIEKHTRQAIAAKKPPGTPGGGPGNNTDPPEPDPTTYTGAISIPVIINIIEKFSGQVSQAQITSQIAILNEDFNNNNPNTNPPTDFKSRVADVNITFTLADTKRKTSSKNSWGTRDAMKKDKRGGIDATDTSTYLNIWVCEIGGGILGYAQFPGGSAATDGIVIGTNYFGKTNGVYGDGRTATHEVGHWLNLRHIWGDGGCSYDDFVTDTPTSDRYNSGCPIYPIFHCESADMTMNYMDYVYDNCMYMFTLGQNDRMRTLFGLGGVRESFVATP